MSFIIIIIDTTRLTPDRYTHIEKSLFVDVFGSSDGRGGDHHRLHLRQVDVSPAVGVLARVVVPQLWATDGDVRGRRAQFSLG